MRFVIYGAGAIGGVVGARLHQSGHPVTLIARGAHREAIAADGLTLITPTEQVTLPIPVAGTPGEAAIDAGDVVLLTTKSQDTIAALLALRETAPTAAVVLLQNGVENERVALRLFADVYGAVVMSPTAHLEPGIVVAYANAVTGAIDIGRYPGGVDEHCEQICAALRGSRFEAQPRVDIMVHKHAKLINNLANAVQAVCGLGPETEELVDRVQEEGRSVLRAAGIEHQVDDIADLSGRWQRWDVRDIPSHPRGGGSSWQSVTRGSGSIESDYLNGEIVLRAREAGIAAPLNETLQRLANETVAGGHRPGWVSAAEVLAAAER